MRHVGGGSRDDFQRHAPEGGFLPQAPGRRFGYNFGPLSFERARFKKDPCFCSELFTSYAPTFYPTYEQMSLHWFYFYPSVKPFSHSFDR